MKTVILTLFLAAIPAGCLCPDTWHSEFYQKHDLSYRHGGCPDANWDIYRRVNDNVDFYIHNERINNSSPTVRIVNSKEGTIECRYLDLFKQNDVREVLRVSDFKFRQKEKFYQAHGTVRLDTREEWVIFNVDERGQLEMFGEGD